ASDIPKDRRVPTQTTGSTGIPLFLYSDKNSRRLRAPGWHLLDAWAGVRSGDQRAWLSVPRPRPRWHWNRPISSWQERRYFRQPEDLVPVSLMTRDDLPRVVHAFDQPVPTFIYGIASVICYIAQHAPERGIQLKHTPRAVIGTSDTFTAPLREQV